MTLQCHTNDDEWHTLYIRRRANTLKAWVDECPPIAGMFTVCWAEPRRRIAEKIREVAIFRKC